MKRAAVVALVLAAAGALRVVGIGYGLPQVFNSDEPHIVNVAVALGRGSLNPYSFKYPTLWPTVLFFSYGAYYSVWSVFGTRHHVADFIARFAWDPSAFYLIGRGLAAVFSFLALLVLWKTESKKAAIPWGALMLAFSPALIESAHSTKPDSIMLFFAAGAWFSALRVYRDGSRHWHWACGACLGLALSCQYTAFVAFLLLPLAHFLGRKREKRRWLWEGAGVSVGAFLLGSPYALLDFPKFYSSLRDFSYLAGAREVSQWTTAKAVLVKVVNFAGDGSIAGAALLIGLGFALLEDKRRAALLGGPILAYVLFLGNHPDGSWPRYLFGCYPGMALLASEGLTRLLARRGRVWIGLAAVLCLGPGLIASWTYDRELLVPDTRLLAQVWIESNLPQGSVMLLDSTHASPRLVMIKEELAELAAKTAKAGSPRSRLYEAMRDSHPGGGYRIYQIQRSAADLRSNPAHVALSQADAPTLDVRSGLDSARAMRIGYVVTSSYGANPARARELSSFFEELYTQAELVKEFVPEYGAVSGPLLRVYRVVSYTNRRLGKA